MKLITILALVLNLAAQAWEVGVSYPATQPPSRNIRIHLVDGASGVLSVAFDVANNLADAVTITKVGVYVDSTTQGPSTILVYDGNTLIGTRGLPANSAGNVFPVNVTTTLQGSATKTLTVKADYPSTFPMASKVTLMVSGVEYVKSDMTTDTSASEIWGPEMHFFHAVANFTLMSAPKSSKTNLAGSTTTEQIKGEFSFILAASGGDIAQLAPSDVQVVAIPIGSYNAYVCPSVSVVTIPNNYTADGSFSTVTVTAVIPATFLPQSGGYRLALSRISWISGLGQRITQVWGFEEFYTTEVVVLKPGVKFGSVSTSTSDTVSMVADVVNAAFTVQARGNLAQGQWIDLPIDSYEVVALSKDVATNGARIEVNVPRSYLAELLGTNAAAFLRVSQ